MKLSTFAIIIAILAFCFGLAFVFIPVRLLAFYGISTDSFGIWLTRGFGAANLFLGMIFWSYSSVSPTAKSWPKLLLFSIVYDVMQLIINLLAILDGIGNSNGWSTVILYALLALGSMYYLGVCNKARAKLAI